VSGRTAGAAPLAGGPDRDAPAAGGRAGVGVGVDMGATLAKIATEEPDAGSGGVRTRFELLPAAELERVAERLRQLRPQRVGLTGAGASDLAGLLEHSPARVNEFAAWGAGASRLLAGSGESGGSRYLLVSLGTGTSVLLIDGMSVNRVGGTALGGGTVVGLGSALLGTGDFEQLCALAREGRRSRVDLRVSDIYRAGEIPLVGDVTASAFGKLARGGRERPGREDLAAAVMGLVGENVALVCAGLAAGSQVRRIVFAGSTLRDNPVLADLLLGVSRQLGRDATVLGDGEFAGALGGLELARERQAGAPGRP